MGTKFWRDFILTDLLFVLRFNFFTYFLKQILVITKKNVNL